ncbi:MAG: hypothetical protein LBN39_04610, partial [Planctomycetaceae bacterium]|nr:hypothetical protein [Planctomycetaceae bacterium]
MHRFVFVLLSVLFFCPVLCGQISLYDTSGFSDGNFVQAPKNYVSLKGRFKGRYLVLEAAIEKDWHLYSATQPDGGTIRSTFRFDAPEIGPELEIAEIRPTTEPKVESNVPGFSVDIEEHDDAVTWVFTFKNELPKQKITGGLDGQVCQTGEGGTCIPFTMPFEAVYDEKLDVSALLKEAENIRDRFVVKTGQTVVPFPNLVCDAGESNVRITVNFHSALLFAFLGGIILNVMPCVLPVIGLKILSFFQQAGRSRLRAFTLNVWYSLGIWAVFLCLAFLSLGLSILFTFDVFNIIMACIVFTMALSLMGVWELSVPSFLGRGKAVRLTQQEGYLGAFFKGMITTLLAIPCGAPLLSPAVNWADMQIRTGQTPLVVLTYSLIALGMASPYLIIGAFPEMLRFLPKPGEWMETFKKMMGFCLLPAVVWILYFVRTECILPTLTLLFALWFLCWVWGHERKTV